MDLLKREIERKKKALEGATGGKRRRFYKSRELRRQQEEQEEKLKEQETTANRLSKRPRMDKDVQQTNKARKESLLGEENLTIDDKAEVSPLTNEPSSQTRVEELSLTELTQELRQMGLAIRLFGESDVARRERLSESRKKYQETLASLSEKEEFRLGQGHGIRNPFLEKEDDETDAQVAVAADDSNRKKEDIVKEEKSTRKGALDDEDLKSDPHKRIYRYFKDLLVEWETSLGKRSDEVKRSVVGRNETKTFKQCKDYIRPLFKLCKTRTLEPGLMSNIIKIVDFCQQGEFVQAHDAYIDVAIGRAAWPIGVTMVGIHARSGRAKIESSNVAHVMNSELQRKYLTSVKRLMTFAQNQRFDVDPSKKVMN